MKPSLIFVLALFVCQAVNASIYKWVDDEGGVHFSDQKPELERVSEVELKINTYNQSNSGTGGLGAPVIMYSTSWCGYCKKARKYFRENNIAFTEYDIEKSAQAKMEYERLGGKGIPVIIVGKKRLNGFTETAFEEMVVSS